MDANKLFLETLADLARRTAQRDEYDGVRAAALLRQLLLDGTPLVAEVNRVHRRRLRFLIAEDDAGTGPAPMFAFHTLAPEGLWVGPGPEPDLPGGPRGRLVTQDQFLNAPVLARLGHWLRVKHVIAHYANVAGGVHLGVPNGDVGKAMLEALELHYGELSIGYKLLQDISRVALAGLEPLRAAVAAQGVVAVRSSKPKAT